MFLRRIDIVVVFTSYYYSHSIGLTSLKIFQTFGKYVIWYRASLMPKKAPLTSGAPDKWKLRYQMSMKTKCFASFFHIKYL